VVAAFCGRFNGRSSPFLAHDPLNTLAIDPITVRWTPELTAYPARPVGHILSNQRAFSGLLPVDFHPPYGCDNKTAARQVHQLASQLNGIAIPVCQTAYHHSLPLRWVAGALE